MHSTSIVDVKRDPRKIELHVSMLFNRNDLREVRATPRKPRVSNILYAIYHKSALSLLSSLSTEKNVSFKFYMLLFKCYSWNLAVSTDTKVQSVIKLKRIIDISINYVHYTYITIFPGI